MVFITLPRLPGALVLARQVPWAHHCRQGGGIDADFSVLPAIDQFLT